MFCSSAMTDIAFNKIVSLGDNSIMLHSSADHPGLFTHPFLLAAFSKIRVCVGSQKDTVEASQFRNKNYLFPTLSDSPTNKKDQEGFSLYRGKDTMYYSGVYLLTVTLGCREGRIWGRGNSFLKSYCEIVLEPFNRGWVGGESSSMEKKDLKETKSQKSPMYSLCEFCLFGALLH